MSASPDQVRTALYVNSVSSALTLVAGIPGSATSVASSSTIPPRDISAGQSRQALPLDATHSYVQHPKPPSNGELVVDQVQAPSLLATPASEQAPACRWRVCDQTCAAPSDLPLIEPLSLLPVDPATLAPEQDAMAPVAEPPLPAGQLARVAAVLDDSTGKHSVTRRQAARRSALSGLHDR